eukprot:4161728-Karenia_brevis.AAC.1
MHSAFCDHSEHIQASCSKLKAIEEESVEQAHRFAGDLARLRNQIETVCLETERLSTHQGSLELQLAYVENSIVADFASDIAQFRDKLRMLSLIHI